MKGRRIVACIAAVLSCLVAFSPDRPVDVASSASKRVVAVAPRVPTLAAQATRRTHHHPAALPAACFAVTLLAVVVVQGAKDRTPYLGMPPVLASRGPPIHRP